MNKSSTPNPMEQTMKMISSLKEDFVYKILLGIIVFILVLATLYAIYMATLNTKECNFMTSLYGTVDGSIKSLNTSDPNCQFTVKDYYIKTAYNCCSGGSYQNDFVSTCVLKNIFKQGVRCLDFEIYSDNNKPVVATSTENSNYIKETYNSVPFSDVLNTIVNYAFSTSTAPNANDPIFLHLRIMSTNQTMFQNFANLLKKYDNYLLGPDYSFESHGNNIGDLQILSLSKKIIIIVDKVNNSFMDNKDFYEYVNLTSNSIFMRALPYKDVLNTPDMVELQNYNKRNITICFPDNGSNPPNPSGIVMREMGIQFMAFRYQQVDQNLQENIAFFDKTGYAFALKPENLRYIPVTIPSATPQNPALSYQTRTVSSDYYNFNI